MDTLTAKTVLVAFILALVIGFVVWFLATLLPPFKQYAPQIGVAAFVVVLLVIFLPHLN